MNTGTITEIIGPIVDVHFPESRPAIREALSIEANGETQTHRARGCVTPWT